MNFEEFKYHYWNIFIDYISAYYPLSHETIKKYQYDLNWRALSMNSSIEWNVEFIKEYKDNLTWHLIALNPSIPITSEFVKQYRNRLDWYYLARNKSLPLSDNFIKDNLKSYKVDESHPQISEEFRNHHQDKIIATQNQPTIPEGIENSSLENFEKNWNNWKNNYYPQIYERIIEPNIIGQPIEEILDINIPQPGKFVYLSPPKNDEFGLISSFEPSPRDSINDVTLRTPNSPIVFEQRNLQEGKDRIYSIIGIPSQRFPCLLISNSLYVELSRFNLPAYQKHEAKLVTKKLELDQKYWLLIFEDNTILDECKDITEFEFYFRKFSETSRKRIIKGNKNEFNEIKLFSSKEYGESISSIIEFYPKSVYINSRLDIITLNWKIIVSKRLRDFIIKNGFGPATFSSTIPMVLKSEMEYRKVPDIGNIGIQKISEHLGYYDLKMQRLKNNDPPFKRFKLFSDRLSKAEERLNVIFKKQFREDYNKKKLIFKDGLLTEEFNWLSIEDFFIENSYSDRYPESYKSCCVAGNGCGDYVALTLEKNDDYKLRMDYVVFNHETGEMVENKLQITGHED
jgi:hypothetical protein